MGLPVVGGGGCLMTHSAGSVTTQRKAYKYVMASEPYRYTWYVKQVMANLPILIAFNVKSLRVLLIFSLFYKICLGRYAKSWIFHQYNILQYFFCKVSAWLFNHGVCKIGLRNYFALGVV